MVISMSDIFVYGINVRDFFIIPTIRYNNDGYCRYFTFEWLMWYIGLRQDI